MPPETDTAETDTAAERERFMTLLAPVHERAQATARRLSRSRGDGDDLYQEALLKAMARIADLRDDKAFPAWLYRILLSVHRARYRRSFWRRLLPLDALDGQGDELAGDDGADWEVARTSARRMQAALSGLPAAQREAVVLCDIDGYTLKEVAALQAASLSAVKSRLVRGRARLRRHYERMGWGPRGAHSAAKARMTTSIAIADTEVGHDPTT
ncbi:MAG: RNA polymerase sigma factor SigM [Haliangiales bacterium]